MIWLALPLAVYLCVVLLVFLAQDRLVFVAAGLGKGVPLALPGGVVVERLRLADGSTFRIALCEPSGPPAALLVFFDGNGADLRSGVVWARTWADLGVSAVVAEYPGYGDSDGTPSMESFRAAAEAVGAFAAQRARRAGVPLVAGGISLGTFSAVHLATRAQAGPARLLLLAPMTSVLEVASAHYPWLPVRWLLRHRFDSVTLAHTIRCPTLIVHGERDDIVPLPMGRRLQEAIGASCELLVAEHAGHNDLPITREPFTSRLRRFLAGN